MTNNKQQMAVEWFFHKVMTFYVPDDLEEFEMFMEIVQQAKEMSKEQHANTWDDSRVGYTGDSFRDSVFGQVKDFSEYYEETYGGGEQ
jgi:hypothetical protein